MAFDDGSAAMSFSWQLSYRWDGGRQDPSSTLTKRAASSRRVPFAIVHHANQYLITDGYDNREGISQIVQGYAAALRLHKRYRVPASLHLSGTLIEAIAWHCPWFLQLVRNLKQTGILSLVGGTYAENVMPLFSPAFNLHQLNEHLWLYRQHLGCVPNEVKICWLPERVWDPQRLTPVLTNARLMNSGYRFVVLDDRVLCPTNGSYPGSPRALFDATSLCNPLCDAHLVGASAGALARGARTGPQRNETAQWGEVNRVHRIAGAAGLEAVPISTTLRYAVPPLVRDDWVRLDEVISATHAGSADAILVYADDLEKTAGVGGWDSTALGRYEAFLGWLIARRDVVPVCLMDWLTSQPPRSEAAVETGTYFELAQSWQAGEDYCQWWGDAAWAPYRFALADAQETIRAAEEDGAEARLVDLARKHLLAATYETAWHDPGSAGNRCPAPWAKAVAIHSRSCRVMVAAARWFAQSDRACAAEQLDLDRDGEDEVVLRNEHLYAVLSPGQGGRLLYLFVLTTHGGALVVGNPADDWNFQEHQNRYMDQPPNHPGALADVGHEHDGYRVGALGIAANGAYVELLNSEGGSRLYGASKSMLLAPHARDLVVCYQLPEDLDSFTTQACLSPDYCWLLREGRPSLVSCKGKDWQQIRNRDVSIRIEVDCQEQTMLTNPPLAEVGHGLNVRIEAHTQHFHLLIGSAEVEGRGHPRGFQAARAAIHTTQGDWPLSPGVRANSLRRGPWPRQDHHLEEWTPTHE